MNREMLKNAMGNIIGLKWEDTVSISYDENEILNQNIAHNLTYCKYLLVMFLCVDPYIRIDRSLVIDEWYQ